MAAASRLGVPRAAWLTAALAAAAGLPALLYPPGRDQAVFLLAGRALLGGGAPYVDLWDIKPPGLFLAYMAPAALSGWLPGAVALLDLAALAAAILLAGRLAAAARQPAAGPAAGILLAGLWILGADWWDLGQGEKLAAPLLLAVFLLAGRPGARPAFGAGACLAALFLLKYSLPLVAVPGLLLARDAGPAARESAAAARRSVWVAALAGGAAAVLVPVALWLLAVGALGEAWTATLSFTGHYTRLAWEQPGRLARVAVLTGAAFLRGTWPLWLLAVAALALGRRRAPGTARLRLALVASLALGLVTIVAQGKFFPYHWIVLWGPLALLAGLGAASLAAPAGPSVWGWRRAAPQLLALAAAAGAALASAPGAPGWWASARAATGLMARDEQRAVFRVQGMGADELHRVAAAVAAATSPGTPIYLWGFEPSFYLAARRPFPGRFPFGYPLVAPWAPPAWRVEFLADFRRAAPEVVVIRRRDPIPWVAGVDGDAAARLRHFPELAAELARDYLPDPDLSSRHLQVLRRQAAREGAGSGPP